MRENVKDYIENKRKFTYYGNQRVCCAVTVGAVEG